MNLRLPRTITVKMIGGLGNQLSQYAFGRTLALLNNCNLVLDTSGYKTYKLHSYGLEHFNIAATTTETPFGGVPDLLLRARRRLDRRLPIENRFFATEDTSEFGEKWRRISAPAYLEGYWASEHYFRPAVATECTAVCSTRFARSLHKTRNHSTPVRARTSPPRVPR